MKKETALLIGIAGLGAYLLYRQQQQKKSFSAPGMTKQQQQNAIRAGFSNLLPAKKKLVPKIIVEPLQNITAAEFKANKTNVLNKAGTIIKKLFAKKKVSGFDTVEGLY